MVLNPRGRGGARGRGRGRKVSILSKIGRGGIINTSGPMYRPGPPPMYGPPGMGFAPEPPFAPPYYAAPPAFGYRPPRFGFGRFPRPNFRGKNVANSGAPVPEIDLRKPWVNEEIKTEDKKKQEYLEVWRKSKNDDDWNKYKAQKLAVKTLYDKAKAEYLAAHPGQATLWENETVYGKYFCETCDKSFPTDDDLYLHEAEHETCGREGCEFTAHPKIIAKHIKMQHDSGLYKRIGKLYTEEDIAKWIEERKKRYPSRKVIEEKKALEEEKIKRGEKINEDKSRFNKSFQKKNTEKKTLKTFKARRPRKKKKNQTIQHYEDEEEEERETERKGVPAFVGLKKIYEPEEPKEEEEVKNLNISDDDWDVENKDKTESKPIINQSLLMLASNYDSNDEIVDDESQKENKAEDASADDGSGPEEVKTIRSTTPLPKESIGPKKFQKKRKNFDKKNGIAEKRKRIISSEDNSPRNVTLLEKLLKNEIRHERNVILQCVHYIIKNDFFKS